MASVGGGVTDGGAAGRRSPTGETIDPRVRGESPSRGAALRRRRRGRGRDEPAELVPCSTHSVARCGFSAYLIQNPTAKILRFFLLPVMCFNQTVQRHRFFLHNCSDNCSETFLKIVGPGHPRSWHQVRSSETTSENFPVASRPQ